MTFSINKSGSSNNSVQFYNGYSNKCPECHNTSILNNRCCQCGLVLCDEEFDVSHIESRAYNKEEKDKRARVGPPITPFLPDISLSTVIEKSKIKSPDLKRASKWDSQMPWDVRNLLIAITELKRIGYNLGLPNYIKEESLNLYKKAFNKNLLRGRSIRAMVAACIYYECRNKKFPRIYEEICDQSSETPKNIRNSYKALIYKLNLKVPAAEPIHLVSRFSKELGYDFIAERATIKVLKIFMERFSISGKQPLGYLAGALYLVNMTREYNISQKIIAQLVRITETTLRSRYNEIISKLRLKN